MEPDKIEKKNPEQGLSPEIKSELFDYIAEEQDIKSELLNMPIQSAEFDPSTNQIVVIYYGKDGKNTTQKIPVKEYQKLKDHIAALQLGNTAQYTYINQTTDYMIDERSSIVQSAYQDIDTPFGNEKDKYMKGIELVKQFKYKYLSDQVGLRHALRYGLDGVTTGNYRDKLDSLTQEYLEHIHNVMYNTHRMTQKEWDDSGDNVWKSAWNQIRSGTMKDWERVDRIFEQIKKTSKKIAIDDRIAPKRLVAMTNNMIVEEYRDGILKGGHTNSDNAAELKENELMDGVDYYKGMKDVLEIFNPVEAGGDFLTMVEGKLPGGYSMTDIRPTLAQMQGGPTVANAKSLSDMRDPWQKSKDYQIAQLKKSGIPHATAVKKVEAFMGDGKQSYWAFRLWYLSSRPEDAVMNGKNVKVRKNGISLVQAEKVISETKQTYEEIKSQESDRTALKQSIKEMYFDDVISASEAKVGLPAGTPKMVKIGDWETTDPKDPGAKSRATKNLATYYKIVFPKGRMTTPSGMAEDLISKMRRDQMRYGAYTKFKDMAFGAMLSNRRIKNGEFSTHTMGGSYKTDTYSWSNAQETELNNIIGGYGAISDKKSVEYAKKGYGFAVSLAAMWATGGIMGWAGLTALGTMGAEAAIAARTAGLRTRYKWGRATLDAAAKYYQSSSAATKMLQVAGQITAEGLAFHAISTPISNVLNGVGDITLGMTDRVALIHSVATMFGMKAFGKYLQFTKENCIATNTLKLDQIVQAGKLLTAEVGVLTATGAAVDFVFDKQHPWSFEDMIHTVLTIVALKKGKFLQKVSPEEMIVIKKKFEYVDKDGKKVVKNKTIEFVRQLDPSKIAKSYTETKSQIRSKNGTPTTTTGKVIESGKVMAQMTNDFLFKPTDIEVENLKHELDAMQYKSAIMREMGKRASTELKQFTEQDKQDLNNVMEQAQKDIAAKITEIQSQPTPEGEDGLMLVFERFGQVQQMISEGLLNAQLSTPYGKKLFESQQIQTQKVELQKKIKEGIQKQLKQKAESMLPAAVSGSSNQQDPLQHEQDILRQEQTMSVSDLSDLTKNVVEEVVGSIDDVVIAEQRANEPRHIRNLTNIMRIAQLTDAQRASEGTDFILSQLPTDIAATIRSNKSAMAYLEEAILEGHYCAQAGKLVVYETDANGVELYKADTNDEVPVFTNRGLEYKWQVLGSGIADAMKVVGIDHNKYTQEISNASKQTLIESYCMAKRSSTSTSVRLEVSLDSIVKTESKAIKALNNVVDTDFKTKIAATDISDEQKKDNFFKQALKYEIMLEKLSDDKLTKDLTTDDFESLYKQIEDQVNIRTNDSRGDRPRLNAAANNLKDRLRKIQSYNAVIKNYGDAVNFFGDSNFHGLVKFVEGQIMARGAGDGLRNILKTGKATLKSGDAIRLLLEENDTGVIYDYMGKYVESIFQTYAQAQASGDQAKIESESKRLGGIIKHIRKAQEAINKESGFEKYEEDVDKRPIVTPANDKDNTTVKGRMTSEVKDTEHQRKTSPVYKFHDSLDIAINSINYHVEKHAARFELYQQKMQVEKALKEKRYDIKNTITVDEIQTKVTRIDMQSKGLIRKIDNSPVKDEIRKETTDAIFKMWEIGVDYTAAYIKLLNQQIEDPSLIQDHVLAVDSGYDSIIGTHQKQTSTGQPIYTMSNGTEIYLSRVNPSGTIAIARSVSNPSQSFNLTKQNDVWVETTNTHNQVAPAMYEIKKITRQKEVNGQKVYSDGTRELIITGRTDAVTGAKIALDANKKEVLVMVTRSGSTDVLVLRADPSIILKAVTVETHKNDLPGFVAKMDAIQAKMNEVAGFKKETDGKLVIDGEGSLSKMIAAARASIPQTDKRHSELGEFNRKIIEAQMDARHSLLLSSTKTAQVYMHNFYKGFSTDTKQEFMQEIINNKAIEVYEQPQKTNISGQKLYMDSSGRETTVQSDHSFNPPVENQPIYKYEVPVIDAKGNKLYRDSNGNTTKMEIDPITRQANELQVRHTPHIPEILMTAQMRADASVVRATKTVTTIKKPKRAVDLDNTYGGTGLDNKFGKYLLDQVSGSFKFLVDGYKGQDPNINLSAIKRKGSDIRFKVYTKALREALAIDKAISIFNDGIARPITSKGTTSESKYIYNGISDLVEFFGGYKKEAATGDANAFEFNKIFEGEEFTELGIASIDVFAKDYEIDSRSGEVLYIGPGTTLSPKQVNYLTANRVSIPEILRSQIVSKLPPDLAFTMGNDVTSFIRGVYGKMFVVETDRIMEYVENQLKLGHTNRGTLDWFMKMVDFLGGKGDPILNKQRQGLKTNEEVAAGKFFSLNDIKSRGPQGMEIAGMIKGKIEGKMMWYMANSMSSLHNRYANYQKRSLNNLGTDFDKLTRGFQDYDDDLYTCMAMAKMINGNTLGGSNMGEAKKILKDEMFQSDDHKNTVFGNRFVMDENYDWNNVGTFNKYGDLVDSRGAIKVKKENLLRMYDEKDARHILAAFKQIMNESKRVVRMNEAYQDRTTLTNIEKDIEQMMRELEQVFTGSYFLDANKDYHAAQFTPGMALTQQVSTVNEMANSTNSLIKRITEIKEKYDNFMKEGSDFEKLEKRYDEKIEGTPQGEKYFHPYYLERIHHTMNTLGRTVKEGANQSNKSNQSDLFPGMSKFSDIKDNKLWAQTVLADQIITIINKIPDNIRSLNAKKKVTHADLMSMYKLVGQCFRQLSYSELDEGIRHPEVQKKITSLTEKGGFFDKFFELFNSSYMSTGLGQTIGSKEWSTRMQQEQTIWSKLFQTARSGGSSATVKIWQSFFWRFDHLLYYTNYANNPVSTQVLVRSSRKWFYPPESYAPIGTAEQLASQAYIDGLLNPITIKTSQAGLNDLMTYAHTSTSRGNDLDTIRRVLQERSGIPLEQKKKLNDYLKKLSDEALRQATNAVVDETKEIYLHQKEHIDALLRDHFEGSIKVDDLKEITDFDILFRNIFWDNWQKSTTKNFVDAIVKDDTALQKKQEEEKGLIAAGVDKILGLLPTGKALTVTKELMKGMFEGSVYNGVSWLYAIGMLIFKQDNTNFWGEVGHVLDKREGMSKGGSYLENLKDISKEGFAALFTLMLYRYLFTRFSNPRSYLIPAATWTLNDLIGDIAINKDEATGVAGVYANTWGRLHFRDLVSTAMNLGRVQTYKAQGYSIPEGLSAENVVRVKDFRNGHAEAWIRMYASGEYKRYLGQEGYDDAEVVQSLAPQGGNTYNPKRKEANPVDAVDIFATLFEPRGSITKLENMIKREDPALYISYQNAWKKGAIKHQDYFTLGKVYDNYHSTQPNKVLEDVRLMVSGSGSLIDTSQPSPSTKSTNSGATSTPSDGSTLTDDAGNVIKSAGN